MIRVLVIEDAASLARALLINLRARGFDAHTAGTGADGLAVLAVVRPEVVVLDLGLPDMDGAEVLTRVRAWNAVPVIVLSARATGAEKVKLLGLGADDYVTKPFDIDELVARISAAARRAELSGADPGSPVVRAAAFDVDLAAGQVVRDGSAVRVTPTEWHILEVLARHHDRLVTQQDLLRSVWGEGYEKESQYLRVYMASLRRKLEPDPAHPRCLITEPGIGYRLVSTPTDSAD